MDSAASRPTRTSSPSTSARCRPTSSRRSSRSPTSWSRAGATSASSSRSSCWCAGSRRWPTTARAGPSRPAAAAPLGLRQPFEPHPAQHLGRLRELDLAVLDDLDRVAPRVDEAQVAVRLDPRLEQRRPHRVGVVDHEPEVALPVRPGAMALREREELIAHVEEGHPGHPAAQLEAEQAPVEVERGVEIADLERHVVDADQARLAMPASYVRLLRVDACDMADANRARTHRQTSTEAQSNASIAISAEPCSRSASPSSSCPPPSPTVISSRRSRPRWSTTHADPGGGQ